MPVLRSCLTAAANKMESETDSVRRDYDRLASSYDRRWRAYVDVTLRAVVDSLQPQGQERLVDIACGTGTLERVLLARWPLLQVAGTDISLGMLRQAAAKQGNERAFWVQADAARLPFPDGSFDHAVCANSFHYFRCPLKALKEVQRVLRPRGSFVLVDWCDDYLSCKLCGLWLRLTGKAFFRTYALRGCRSLLEQSGFEILRADRFRVRCIWGMMRLVCQRGFLPTTGSRPSNATLSA